MRLTQTIIASIALCIGAVTQAQPLSISLETEAKLAEEDHISVTGNFNQWQMNEDSKMQWHEVDGHYRFTIANREHSTLINLYKNSDWQNPLATEFGKPFTCGFIIPPDAAQEFRPDFHGWAQDNEIEAPDTTTGELITLSNFPMEALQRSGDIFIYLPTSYQQHPKKHYPVLYMLDGQNLFSEAMSYSYEWQVDETVTRLGLDVIVVGIANGPERWQEYNPWPSVNYMNQQLQGKGKQTMAFITRELKPHIDKHYRTKKDAEHTAIAGSSLGGLMALYAAIEYHHTFGKVAAFSPAFSFATATAQTSLDAKQSNLLNAIKATQSVAHMKIYFDMGEVEYGSFDLTQALYSRFLNSRYQSEQLKMVQDKNGRHCELDWSRRLPGALKWLFSDAVFVR